MPFYTSEGRGSDWFNDLPGVRAGVLTPACFPGGGWPLSESSVQLWESRETKDAALSSALTCRGQRHQPENVPRHPRVSEPQRGAPSHSGCCTDVANCCAACVTPGCFGHPPPCPWPKMPPSAQGSAWMDGRHSVLLPSPWGCVSCLGPAGGRLTPESSQRF